MSTWRQTTVHTCQHLESPFHPTFMVSYREWERHDIDAEGGGTPAPHREAVTYDRIPEASRFQAPALTTD